MEVFPKHVAEALMAGRQVEPESRDMVTIFFSTLSPMKVSNLLGRLYSKFDALSEKHDVFKVETIGDAYMAVSNLNKIQPDHTKRIADFAVDAIAAANSTMIDEDDPSLGYVSIRCGIHSGPCACGSTLLSQTTEQFLTHLVPFSVSTGMESTSKENRIHCSAETASLLQQQYPSMALTSRGLVSTKGKGDMVTFWVNERELSAITSVA